MRAVFVCALRGVTLTLLIYACLSVSLHRARKYQANLCAVGGWNTVLQMGTDYMQERGDGFSKKQ